MLKFETIILKHEFEDRRRIDWRFALVLQFIGLWFHSRFSKPLIITCLGRNYNPKSAHCYSEPHYGKLVCAADIRSWGDGEEPYLTVRELTELANLNNMVWPYMDILIEDERMRGKKPDGGNHVHIEINPQYWINF